MPPDRTFEQEVAKRAGEAGGGLAAAAKAVGLRDHARMLDRHDQRLRRGEELGYRALGVSGQQLDELSGAGQGGDDVGDIVVTGDQTYNITQPPQRPAPSGQPGWSSVLPWALAAALGGGMASQWMRPAPSPAPVQQQQQGQDTDTQYELRISGE